MLESKLVLMCDGRRVTDTRTAANSENVTCVICLGLGA